MTFIAPPNPFLLWLEFSLLSTVTFFPQVLILMAGPIIISLLSKKVSILKIIFGLIFVTIVVSLLFVTPSILVKTPTIGGVQSNSFWNFEGFFVYTISVFVTVYFYWKLRGKLFVFSLLLFLLSLLSLFLSK